MGVNKMFKTEKLLVETTVPKLIDIFNVQENNIFFEVSGLFGIPDVVLNNGSIIAIEFKLSNWKGALIQAFRYKSFADQAYVFLDDDYIHRALNHIEMFESYDIGLSSVNIDGEVINFYTPNNNTVYTHSIREKALSMLS